MAEACIPVRINHLCCPICSGVLKNPVTLPCGHNFCMQCIQDCWDCDVRISCPKCSCMFTSRPPLIINTTLAELARDTERRDNGEKRRQEDTGAFLQVLKRSRSSTETKTLESTLCGRHNRPLDFYCRIDKLTLCTMCASAEHQGHRIGCVQEERRREQVCKTEMLQFFFSFKGLDLSNLGAYEWNALVRYFIRCEQWTRLGKGFVIEPNQLSLYDSSSSCAATSPKRIKCK